MDQTEKGESAAQLFARLSVRPSLHAIGKKLFTNKNEGRHCIEILGDEGSGKTEVSLHLLVNTIVPKVWKGIELGGMDSSTLFIDTDYKFPVLRFISLIEQRLLTCITASNNIGDYEVDSEEFVKFCLQKFFKINCHSTFQLIETLQSLEGFFCDNPDTVLLVIDNISSYYWTERLYYGRNEIRDNQKPLTNILQYIIDQNLVNIVLIRNIFGNNMEHNYNKFGCFQKLVKEKYHVKKDGMNVNVDEFSLTCVTTALDPVRFKITDTGVKFI